MKKSLAGFLVALIFLTVHSARADVDYRCLNLCKNNGQPTSVCMTQCSYNVPHAANVAPPPVMNSGVVTQSITPKATINDPIAEAYPVPNHNLLGTLRQGDDTILLQPHTAATSTSDNPDRDYTCLNQCLQNGMRYQLCNESCLNMPVKNAVPIPTNGPAAPAH
ncbi:MAG TPA: hypothetical protein VFR09_03820 [Alphaproteobacteria bacterium]|nr:hypothetical protein [Alphaproteobacteria bacterium]